MSKIVILTTQDLGNHITEEDLLINELKSRGHQLSIKAWETLNDEGEDLFLIRTTWNYTNYLKAFLNKLKSISDRLYNPIKLVEWNSNKKYLLELENKGHGVMPLKIASNQTEVLRAMEELDGNEFIVKPLVGASASGLVRFLKKDVPPISEEMIVQKFYPSITKGEISLFFFKGVFAYAVKKIPKQGDIRVQEEYGSTIIEYVPNGKELSNAKKIIQDIPSDWLYARVDIVPEIGLIELECIEPSLYFSKVPRSVGLFADNIESVL